MQLGSPVCRGTGPGRPGAVSQPVHPTAFSSSTSSHLRLLRQRISRHFCRRALHALDDTVAREGPDVAEGGAEHDEGPRATGQVLQAKADREHDGGRLVEVPGKGRVSGGEGLHKGVLEQIVGSCENAGEEDKVYGVRAELHDLHQDAPIGQLVVARSRPLRGMLHQERRRAEEEGRWQRHVEGRVYRVQLHAPVPTAFSSPLALRRRPHAGQHQIQCSCDVRQGAHQDPEDHVMRLAGTVRARALGDGRQCGEEHPGDHEEHLNGPHVGGLAHADLHDECHQWQARADDEVQGHSQEREAEVVESNVHGECGREREDASPLLGRREDLRAVSEGREVQDRQDDDQDDESDNLLEGGDEEGGRDPLHLQLLRHHGVGEHHLHVQAEARLRTEVDRQQAGRLHAAEQEQDAEDQRGSRDHGLHKVLATRVTRLRRGLGGIAVGLDLASHCNLTRVSHG
mmetsp:Transcript_83424/g.214849  ORF Transcript_83424/g.214849 Transcript_83424/m.214849 type:complete len:457 (-) Transcript_83424:305-1675(-)